MVSDADNATLLPGRGDNSNVTYTMTLQELNEAEVRRLIPTIVYLAVLSVIGIIGNSFVCHVYRTRYRLSNSQCFILCLSAIDLFSCCVVMPLEIATVINQYTFEYMWLCKLSRFFNTLGTLSASFLLLFIAIDRYRKVCRPFGWQIKARVAKFLCVLSVILGLVFSWPAIFIYGKQTFDIPEYKLVGTECSTNDSMLGTIFPLINAALFGGLFIVGIVSVCILYCFIGREVHKHAKKMPRELTVRNPSSAMLSSTLDARTSRVSGEIEPNTSIRTKKESQRKTAPSRRSRKCDSESSWTDKKDFELSCTMDASVASETEQAVGEDTPSEDSGIKSDQTNKDEHDVNIRKDFTEDSSEAMDNNKNKDYIADTLRENDDVIKCNGVEAGLVKTRNSLEPVKELDTESDTSSVTESDYDKNIKEEIRNSKESCKSRTMSEFSCSSEIIKPKTFRHRLSSIGSRISTAIVRRMTSVVSATGAGTMSVVKTQYLKQARARKTAFLMFLISLAFVLSYMPHLILMMVRQLKDRFVEDMSDDGRALYKFFLRSYFLNCAINPVIYGVCDSRFRTACKEIFSRCCSRGKLRGMN